MNSHKHARLTAKGRARLDEQIVLLWLGEAARQRTPRRQTRRSFEPAGSVTGCREAAFWRAGGLFAPERESRPVEQDKW